MKTLIKSTTHHISISNPIVVVCLFFLWSKTVHIDCKNTKSGQHDMKNRIGYGRWWSYSHDAIGALIFLQKKSKKFVANEIIVQPENMQKNKQVT